MTGKTVNIKRSRIAWLFDSAEGKLGVVLVGIVLVVVIFGRLIAPYGPDITNLNAALQAPSFAHWFGTDETGRDILSRVLVGASYTVPTAMAVVLFGLLFGSLVGTIAGYFGGWVGNVLMRVTDLFLSYPALLLAIAVSAALGQGLVQAAIALSVVVWAGYARLAHVQTVTIKNRLYMDAATVAGTSTWRKVLLHLLPNSSAPLLIKATIDVAFSVEWIASLGFIGLGARQPAPEWGAMIATSRQFALTSWWYVLFPSVALLITVLGFVLLGSALEDQLSGRRTLSRRALRQLKIPDDITSLETDESALREHEIRETA